MEGEVGIDNRTEAGWELAPGATPEGSFGLQLFETGDKAELDERNRAGTLPAVGRATATSPNCRGSSSPEPPGTARSRRRARSSRAATRAWCSARSSRSASRRRT